MSLHAAAANQIDRYGETLTLRQTTAGTYDPATQTYSGETTTTSTGKGFVYPYASREIDGSTVVAGDMKVMLPGDFGATPAEGNYVERDSIRYRVLQVAEVRVYGKVAYYELHARGTE